MNRIPCILAFSVPTPLHDWVIAHGGRMLVPTRRVPPLDLVWQGGIGYVGWQPHNPDDQAYLFAQICQLQPAYLWLWQSPELGFLAAYTARFLAIPSLATPHNPEDPWGNMHATGNCPDRFDSAWLNACLKAVPQT
jgi:hypothetical protein